VKRLSLLRKSFIESDSHISDRESRARTPGNKNRWGEIKDLNDQAYFMMIFAQFEDRINEYVKELVEKKNLASSWWKKRPWTIIEIDRLSFMQKVALLTPKGGKEYNRVHELYYNLRNRIAHGSDPDPKVGPINVLAKYDELRELTKKLKP